MTAVCSSCACFVFFTARVAAYIHAINKSYRPCGRPGRAYRSPEVPLCASADVQGVVQRSACACRKEGGVLRCLSASEQISSPPSVTHVDWHSKDFAHAAPAAAAAAALGEIPALLCCPFSRVTFFCGSNRIPKCKPPEKSMLHRS